MYEFQNQVHPNLSSMLDHIAEADITANGNNTDEYIETTLAESTDLEMAAGCVDGFGLNMAEGRDSHMKVNGYTIEDLANAFTRYRESRR